MKKILASIFILITPSLALAAGDTMSRESTKGLFSVGLKFGMGASRLLNTDSSFANYKTNGYGLDLDILLWDSGAGDIRLFGQHSQMSGQSESTSSNKIESAETTAGVKFFVGKHLYLAGGLGNGNSKLKSDVGSISLSYQMVKALFGLEVQLSESFYLGLELSYRSAPIKKDGNSSLSENSYIEGMGAGLRLVWSPPSVTFSPGK